MSPCGCHTETPNRLYQLIWQRCWDREEAWDKLKKRWGNNKETEAKIHLLSMVHNLVFVKWKLDTVISAVLHYFSNYHIQRLPVMTETMALLGVGFSTQSYSNHRYYSQRSREGSVWAHTDATAKNKHRFLTNSNTGVTYTPHMFKWTILCSKHCELWIVS